MARMKLFPMLLPILLTIAFKAEPTESSTTCKEIKADPSLAPCGGNWTARCTGNPDDHIVSCGRTYQLTPKHDNGAGEYYFVHYWRDVSDASRTFPYCKNGKEGDTDALFYSCDEKQQCSTSDPVSIFKTCEYPRELYTVCSDVYPTSSVKIIDNKTIACTQKYRKDADGSWKPSTAEHRVIAKDQELESGMIKCEAANDDKSEYIAKCHGKDCWDKINDPKKMHVDGDGKCSIEIDATIETAASNKTDAPIETAAAAEVYTFLVLVLISLAALL